VEKNGNVAAYETFVEGRPSSHDKRTCQMSQCMAERMRAATQERPHQHQHSHAPEHQHHHVYDHQHPHDDEPVYDHAQDDVNMAEAEDDEEYDSDYADSEVRAEYSAADDGDAPLTVEHPLFDTFATLKRARADRQRLIEEAFEFAGIGRRVRPDDEDEEDELRALEVDMNFCSGIQDIVFTGEVRPSLVAPVHTYLRSW
jgi:hypothetical protein